MARARLNQQSFIRKALERLFEQIALSPLHAQLANELLECGPRMRKLANMLEHAGIREAFLGIARMLRHYRNYKEPL